MTGSEKKVDIDCLFCKIISREIPSHTVYEDNDVLAYLDIKPVNPGHTLVVPKEHFKNLYELDDSITAKLFQTVRDLSIAIKKGLGADGINIEMNNDRPAGQVIFHAHVHIVPRIDDDGLRHWPGHDYKEGEAEETLQRIKSASA